METYISTIIPDAQSDAKFKYTHDYEGNDDMPAHIKCSLFGPSVTIPICDGKLLLGAWQGVVIKTINPFDNFYLQSKGLIL
jgi:secondary thiamine-phosphate synthase enzyme